METTAIQRKKTILYISLGLVTLLLLLVALFGYRQYRDIQTLETVQLANTAELESRQVALATASSTIAELEAALNELREEYEELEEDYEDERDQNEVFEDQLRDLGRTVTVLDRLANTDEELLRKYSRVSFLNENYIPESLSDIDDQWKYDESREHELLTPVMPFFEEMLEDALDDGVEMYVVSAYRSFEYQADLKQRYLVTYGTGANEFSADQGFSEHQLGTAIDFTAPGLNGGLTGFENTDAFAWLEDNAHRYGFILSYPPDNQFYVFEPWHWRFVGEDLADDLHDEDANFYDWDQRRINEYLVEIFE